MLEVGVSGRTLDRHVGGNTTYVRRLYETLAAFGVRPRVLRPPAGARPRLRSVRYAAYEAVGMERDARRYSVPIIHYPADTGPVRPSRFARIVVTLHGVGTLYEPGIRSSRASKLWLWRARRAAQVADAVVTVSESSRRSVLELVGAGFRTEIAVIPHGLDGARFHPATPAEVATAHRAHGVVRPFILYVGNLEPRKNIVELVRAVEALVRDGYDLELLVGGKPAWDAEATLHAIDRSATARRLGWLSDAEVRALMSSCRAFAFPSLYEGFGLPVLEAMACGAPVVCTDRGSLPEVAGDAAVYAQGTTAAAVAAALADCLKRDAAELSRRSRQRASVFSWERSAQQHAALFERLQAARARSGRDYS
jgi:glycosyltransferase involved in cell wall biosynthesis